MVGLGFLKHPVLCTPFCTHHLCYVMLSNNSNLPFIFLVNGLPSDPYATTIDSVSKNILDIALYVITEIVFTASLSSKTSSTEIINKIERKSMKVCYNKTLFHSK